MFNPSVGLVRYTFDETVPSMPDQEIRIYSLTENRSVRQAVTDYKRQHTDLYVRYETGMSGDGGMTAEDAIEMILAGASAVSVGTANFRNPQVTMEIVQGITEAASELKAR